MKNFAESLVATKGPRGLSLQLLHVLLLLATPLVRLFRRFMNYSLFVLMLICCMAPDKAVAAEEQLAFGQAADGSVIVTLSGNIRFCDPLLGGFKGEPTASVTGTNINVVSNIVPGECGPPPPDFVPPPPVPYSISVNVGQLADGLYSAKWAFIFFEFGAVSQSFQRSLLIQGGIPVGPVVAVPALSPTAMLSAVICLLIIGCMNLRRSNTAPLPSRLP